MSYEPEDLPPEGNKASDRVSVPSILLIVVGILNLLCAIGPFSVSYIFSQMTVQDFEKAVQQNPQQKQQIADMKKQGYTMQDILNIYVYGGAGTGIVNILAAIVTILGGICMRSMRLYFMAVIAAFLAAIPCVSLTACCGIGEGIGIWSLVVLFSSEVKAAFR